MKIIKKEKFFFKELTKHHIFTRYLLKDNSFIWKSNNGILSFNDDPNYFNQNMLESYYNKNK